MFHILLTLTRKHDRLYHPSNHPRSSSILLHKSLLIPPPPYVSFLSCFPNPSPYLPQPPPPPSQKKKNKKQKNKKQKTTKNVLFMNAYSVSFFASLITNSLQSVFPVSALPQVTHSSHILMFLLFPTGIENVLPPPPPQ